MEKYIYDSAVDYSIKSYHKYFPDEDYHYALYLKNGQDTLYFLRRSKEEVAKDKLRTPNEELEIMEFFVGKYEYLYENQALSPKQMAYYYDHRDSLKRVKGNDLPELPEK